ncbi:MAG: hypothetical protein KGH89_04165 [Thaumarchaeota archaeon]|nr:hypothetical protein [Nitrososphaerota archaeon]MDE1867082.1 hypothetical protein [Nitrososphaerota archaeon]
MTTEKTEVSAVENMTKQEMTKIIKTAKREAESSKKEGTVSIYDVMKNNTSEIIQKMELKLPTYTQLYTDLYTKYLHTIDDLYGTCYLSEKKFFDKLGMDKTVVRAFDAYCKSVTSVMLSQIDMSADFAKMYVQFRLATIDSYDKVVHLVMDSYARAWDQFNSYNKK